MKKLLLGLTVLAVLIGVSAGLSPLAVRAEPPQSSGARRITPEDLLELFKRGQAVIVDVRTEAAYKTSHIKGAKLIPASEIANRLDELPRDKLIATYCA